MWSRSSAVRVLCCTYVLQFADEDSFTYRVTVVSRVFFAPSNCCRHFLFSGSFGQPAVRWWIRGAVIMCQFLNLDSSQKTSLKYLAPN